MRLSTFIPALQLPVRAGLSAALAIGIAELLGLQYPLYAMIGAVIVTDLSPERTRKLGVQRFWGTVLGAGIGAVVCRYIPPGPLAIGLSILMAMFLSHLLGLKEAAKVTGYICGIIVLEYRGDPWSYAAFRLLETVLGIGVAVMVSLVPKLVRMDETSPTDS